MGGVGLTLPRSVDMRTLFLLTRSFGSSPEAS